jgi:uracil-DNA glycosylase
MNPSRLTVYQNEIRACTRCHADGLLHVEPTGGVARPILAREPTAALGILIVGEAPNHADTYDPRKGYLTYEPGTDPTGTFMLELLVDVVGLAPTQIGDVLFTNAVACLPARRDGRHPVRARQRDHCRPWLARLIDDADARVVVSLGKKPLEALGRIEPHGLRVSDAGKAAPWYGRHLLPLYHPGRLGRISRPADLQRRDIASLRAFVPRG